MSVFVLDKRKKPLMPCSEKRARLLLDRKKAVVHKMYPFTIRLKERIGGELQDIAVKIDPGSKHTGLAVVREVEKQVIVSETSEEGIEQTSIKVEKEVYPLFLAQLDHRGSSISEALTQRRAYRNRRRNKNLRRRPARFSNRKRSKQKGWLAPSLMHRINTTMSWVKRFQRLCPVTRIVSELVKFDMQKMMNPEITGVTYQHGTLFGYEVKEYLLEKWGHKCIYCGIKDVPLEVEHLIPKAKGGTNRVSNLTLSCRSCNLKKGKLDVHVFLQNDQVLLNQILSYSQIMLKDAAVVNSTRKRLIQELLSTGLPVETGTGARTKHNRKKFGVEKDHAYDAICVGKVDKVGNWQLPILQIKCTGRGRYQRTVVDKFGFPRGYLMKSKSVFGFQTGDIVKADVLKGKYMGKYVGRVAVRKTGSFNITTNNKVVQGISYKYCKVMQRSDGYSYNIKK